MPGRSTLPLPSGQPSPSSSRFVATYSRLRRVKSSISSRNRSSPVQRQISATAPGNLTISSVLKSYRRAVGVGLAQVLAVPDRSVGDHLVDDHARAVAEDVGDLVHRAHVVLDQLELPERVRCVGGVLAVDGEQPGVVGEAGADPADARHRALERPLLALVGPADLEVGRPLREVGEVLLAPVDRVLQQPVAREAEPGPAREGAARTPLLGQQAPGIGDQAAELAARFPAEFSEPATATHSVVERPPRTLTL